MRKIRRGKGKKGKKGKKKKNSLSLSFVFEKMRK